MNNRIFNKGGRPRKWTRGQASLSSVKIRCPRILLSVIDKHRGQNQSRTEWFFLAALSYLELCQGYPADALIEEICNNKNRIDKDDLIVEPGVKGYRRRRDMPSLHKLLQEIYETEDFFKKEAEIKAKRLKSIKDRASRKKFLEQFDD